MPRRTDHARPFNYRATFHHRRVRPAPRHSDLNPALAYTRAGWGQLAQQHLRGMSILTGYPGGPDDGPVTHIATPGGGISWASARHTRDSDDGYVVEQEGPRRIWDELEALYRRWTALGEPNVDRFGMTFTHSAGPDLWLDDSTGDNVWPCPPSASPLSCHTP